MSDGLSKHQRYYRRHRARRRAEARAWNQAHRDRKEINDALSERRRRRAEILAEIARLEEELDEL
jgi:hypothetical protein